MHSVTGPIHTNSIFASKEQGQKKCSTGGSVMPQRRSNTERQSDESVRYLTPPLPTPATRPPDSSADMRIGIATPATTKSRSGRSFPSRSSPSSSSSSSSTSPVLRETLVPYIPKIVVSDIRPCPADITMIVFLRCPRWMKMIQNRGGRKIYMTLRSRFVSET